MSSSDLVLFHGLASTCSKKVRLCLFEKGLAFESRLLDLQKFEQHRPEYLALNPNGVVPTLVHAGRPVIESTIILEYLEEAFPDTPLRPNDPHARAAMRLWTRFSDDVAYKAVYAPTWMKLSSTANRNFSAEEWAATLARIPTKERRDRWAAVTTDGFSEAELQDAYDKMILCLTKMDAALRDGPWLVGADYSLADIAMVPFIDRIRNLRPDLLEGEGCTRVRAWYETLKRRPAFDRAFDFKDARAASLPNI